MADEALYQVTYTGEGIRAVAGLGCFQNGTIAYAEQQKIEDLLDDADFAVVDAEGKKVGKGTLPAKPAPAPAPAAAPEPAPEPAPAPAAAKPEEKDEKKDEGKDEKKDEGKDEKKDEKKG